jgi:putative ABC transport system ATP-binding protein
VLPEAVEEQEEVLHHPHFNNIHFVIPVKTGIQFLLMRFVWIPAFAGMTLKIEQPWGISQAVPHSKKNLKRKMYMIVMENVTKIYRMGEIDVTALKDISIRVEKGEFVSIMGPSGSGKSTLMNIIGCLDVPTSGSYGLDGIAVSGLNDNQLAEIRNKKIGFVFQTFNLLAREEAIYNVELPMIYNNVSEKERRETAQQMLDIVGLAHRAKHKPNELSGGERQRVAIARSLVNKPSIILADEPTGNLDSKTGEEIMAIFQKLNGDGITIILVTHERDIAASSQRIIHLRDGLVEGVEKL